jgi:hypothetical protein
MKMIDPTYLRFLCDELKSGKLDRSNLGLLPIGVTSFFDRIFNVNDSIIERNYSLDKFISMSLLGAGSSLEQISSLTAQPIDEWHKFIQQYAHFFSADSQGNYRLFHDRFGAYLFQRSSHSIIKRNAQIILDNIELVNDVKWIVENKGYFLYLNEKLEDLFAHISLHPEQQLQSWWIKDLERLLDGLYCYRATDDIDFTLLCELLRGCFDFKVQRKGVRLIVMNASKIEWDNLESFFDTTRFQYELAIEFSKHPLRLPANWQLYFLNEDHPCSYTFSYVWKYAQFNGSGEIDRQLLSSIWLEGSPYQRIIVIMIWGYRKLNGNNDVWLDDLIALNNDWHYLHDEKESWLSSLEVKKGLNEQIDFTNLKVNVDEQYQYIFDNYWSLFDRIEQLNKDVNNLWKHPLALDIAFWIYRHPVWEIGKIANEIVVNRLRVRAMRSEAIEWLLSNWENEEFYAIGEVIFELKAYFDSQAFLNFFWKVINTSNCQLRGSLISDLITYLEGDQNEEFHLIICEDYLPKMIAKACDIWEVQELIRLLKFFIESGTLTEIQAIDYIAQLELARDIDDALNLDYNEFWKQAEINKGIIR